MKRQLGAIILLALGAAPALGDDALYVHSERAALYTKPALGGDEVTGLARGNELRLLESRDRWHRVRFDGQEGWLPELVVGNQPPQARESRLEGATELDDGPRRRAGEVTTAGAVRGLEEDEAILDDPDLDLEELRRLEAFGVTQKEAVQFLLQERE